MEASFCFGCLHVKKITSFCLLFLCCASFFVIPSFVSCVCVCVCVWLGSGGGKSIQTTGAEVQAHLPFGRGRQNQHAPTILTTPAFPLSVFCWFQAQSHCAGKKMIQFQGSEVEEPSPGN